MPDSGLALYSTCLKIVYMQEARKTINTFTGWSHILNKNLSLTMVKRRKRILEYI